MNKVLLLLTLGLTMISCVKDDIETCKCFVRLDHIGRDSYQTTTYNRSCDLVTENDIKADALSWEYTYTKQQTCN